MNISILLPYKENFSESYAGAVALYVNDTARISKHRKRIKIYGNTEFKKTFNLNYKNIPLKKNILKSQSKLYVSEFIKTQKKNKKNLIEVHNRPVYIKLIREKLNQNLVLYFHNDPLSMAGSKTVQERLDLITICSKIIFNSQWTKSRFLNGLNRFIHSSEKLEVIQQSATKTNIDISKKKKIITFTGKLNTAKGYDLFGKAIVKILDKYKDWKANVIGDELREKITFKHKNLKILGFLKHKEVLKIFNKTSIAVACSRWEEPFGRTSLEASSRGCSVIISNRGGLPETITNGIILKKLSYLELYKAIEQLIKNKKKRQELQKLSINNFYLTHKFVSNKIDKYRDIIAGNKISIFNLKKNKRLKILHVTNFNERHNGRLFYNTGKRINNGLIRLNHSVLEFSDRDIVSYYRRLNDINGSKRLNQKLIEVISNYVPDIIILGHADLIKKETLSFIKKNYPNIKIAQWFLDRMDTQWISNKKRFLDKIDMMDASFCTTEPKSLNIPSKYRVFYIPNPVDESFEKLENYKNNNFNNDVFFAMSHGVHRGVLKKGKFDQRENFINKLISVTPNIRFDLYGMNGVQPVWADNYLYAISQSKIGLNLSQGKPAQFYSSDRFAQLIGNGLLVMVDEKTKIGNFFNKDEIILYKNITDLSSKIVKYSNDNRLRCKIAKKGRDKYFKYFNSTIVADFIISKTIGTKKNFFWENV